MRKNKNGASVIILLWNIKNVNSVLLLGDYNNFLQSYPIHGHFAYDSPRAPQTLWKQEAIQDFIDFSHILSPAVCVFPSTLS